MLASFYFEFTPDNEIQMHPFTEWIGSQLDKVPFVGILLLLMLFDIITGTIAAFIEGRVDSNLSFKGAAKKAQMLLFVGAGLTFQAISSDVPWGKYIAMCLCLAEMWSILENCSRAGLPIPEVLKEALSKDKYEYLKENKLTIEVTSEKGDKGDKGDNGEDCEKEPSRQRLLENKK